MAQCCQSIQLPLPESLVYGLQKRQKKGSIIFYRSSPVALTRESRTSVIKVEDVVPSPGSVLCAVNAPSVWVSSISSAKTGRDASRSSPDCCLPG